MFFYNLLLFLSAVTTAPYFVVRMLSTPKFRAGLAERLGHYPDDKIKAVGDGPTIWIHAASVGEVKAAAPLVSLFKKHCPQYKILFSTMTLAGNRLCRETIDADAIIFFPLDFPAVVKKAVKYFSPKLLVIIETELWPNFLKAISKSGAPAVLVNGRVSDKSFPRYRKVNRFFKRVLGSFEALIMQDDTGRDRVIELGADPEKVHVAGSLKHDSASGDQFDQARAESIRQRIGFGPTSRVIVGGCTHPGEEEILVDIFLGLKEKMPGLKLVLAPRHLERLDEVEKMLDGKGLSFGRYSDQTRCSDREIVIIDIMGVLSQIYLAASVVFIGKSLTRSGGHNPLEPAAVARPIVFGPNMENFAQISATLIDNHGAKQVQNADSLRLTIEQILTDSNLARQLGQNARTTLDQQTGAANRTLEIVRELLGEEDRI
jgi:3-deoxy-D-manno-octulosonic-acid transferase